MIEVRFKKKSTIIEFVVSALAVIFEELADRVRYFKEDERGISEMCKVMEDMRNETIERRNIEVAKSLYMLGKLTIEEIASTAGLTIDKVKEVTSTLAVQQ